jgi:serine/threonine protein kinase
MGHVYLAMNAGPAGVQKLLVVKQLREDFATSVAARSMFLDEARISTRLNHPNIVQTNEVVDDEDDLYLVMEFLDGQPLSRILEPSHRDDLSLAAKLRILIEALEGLHYAHELTDYDGTPMNFVHRDVSPQNIIVTYDGHVKLVDFGVAKAADAQTVTESGVFKGKVRYASPEQALCAPNVDRRADVFALGTILWEIVTGRRLWQDQADASVLLALASGAIPRMRETLPAVPPALDAICSKALANDAASRYATALEFRDALVGYLREHGGPETDIGRALSKTFEGERRRLHAVIDSQVKAAREASSGPMTVRNIPLLGPDSSGTLASASEKSVVRGGLSVESSSTHSRAIATEPAWRSRPIVIAVVGLLLAIGLIAFFVPSRKPAASAAATAAESHVHLSLRATPPGARFVLDGRNLATNPYEEDVARDDASHRLSIRADGFVTRDIDARLTRDVNVDVTLAAASPSAPQAPVALPPTTAVAQPSRAPTQRFVPTAPQPQPQPTKSSSQRRIDEDDPYKK